MKSRVVFLALLALALAIPFVGNAIRSGMTPRSVELPVHDGGYRFDPINQPFEHRSIGGGFDFKPRIANVKILDFNNDSRNDILVADAQRHQVVVYLNQPDGSWDERVIGADVQTPAHVTVADLDQDGRQDVLVGVLGSLDFYFDMVGQVVLFHQQTDGSFERRLLLNDVSRVADIQVGDLSGDGLPDIAVAAFGYDRGAVLWLENMGDLRFRDHELHWAPGAIHVPLADFNQDGRLDIMTVVSQDEEEIWAFENLGDGAFRGRRIHYTINFDIGSAGLVAADVNQDGRMDLIWPVGDNFEDPYTYPQPYHGCYWLENQGDFNFELHHIAEFGGTYAADAGDLNGDGHVDIVLVSMTNVWTDPRNASLIALMNDGEQNFTPRQIASDPIQLITVAAGDLTGDGRDDIVAGGMHFYPPFMRMGRVSAWMSQPTAPEGEGVAP